MTQILIDFLFVGVVLFTVVRKTRKRPAIVPGDMAAPDRPASPATRRKPSKTKNPRGVAAAAAPIGTSTPIDPPHYLLDGRHARATRDSMAETLIMMAGPGVCTPRSSPP